MTGAGQPYTAGSWLVCPGREDEFVAAWKEFTAWSLLHAQGADSFVLIRHAMDPLRFLSFGAWTDADAVANWRGSDEFAERLGRCRALCEKFEGHDYTVAAAQKQTPAQWAGEEEKMALRIGDTAPDFEAETSEGKIRFHDWIGNAWAVLFSHPKDFTPVCTTELGYMAKIRPEFDRRNVKIIGLSVDSIRDHARWASDIEETQGYAPNYPLIGDADLKVSKLYGMLPAETSGEATARTPADNQTVRNVFVIGPDKKIKLILVYPMTTGRNFDEVLRVIDSLQLTAHHRVSTPVNWRRGEDVMIAGSVSDEQAKELFNTWQSPKPYIRIVPQPPWEEALVP